MKYFPKIVDLSGFTAKHWSKMKVGDDYVAKIKLPHRQGFPKGTVNYGKTKTFYDSYYLVKNIK